jgi:predicted NBD/HSP70 family sugar kinase
MRVEDRGSDRVVVGCAISEHTLTVNLPGNPPNTVDSHDYPLTAANADDVLRQLAEVLLGLDRRISGIGLSVGGHVNHVTGTVVLAPDLVWAGCDWRGVRAAERVSDLMGCPTVVDNDVNCMAWFHFVAGAAKGCKNFATVYLGPDGKGLGSCAFCNGTPVRGANGGAGELGHVVISPTGARCRCGNRGCLEAMLSLDNIAREVNWGLRDSVDSFMGMKVLVDEGDPRASAAFARAGRNLGQGLAAVVNMFNPELILLGGPHDMLASEEDGDRSASIFWPSLRDALSIHSFSDMNDACTVRLERLGVDTAAAGAAMLAAAALDD